MLGSKFFLKNEELLEFCMLRITTKRILKNRIVGLFPQGGPTVSLLPWTRHWPVCSGKGVLDVECLITLRREKEEFRGNKHFAKGNRRKGSDQGSIYFPLFRRTTELKELRV